MSEILGEDQLNFLNDIYHQDENNLQRYFDRKMRTSVNVFKSEELAQLKLKLKTKNKKSELKFITKNEKLRPREGRFSLNADEGRMDSKRDLHQKSESLTKLKI